MGTSNKQVLLEITFQSHWLARNVASYQVGFSPHRQQTITQGPLFSSLTRHKRCNTTRYSTYTESAKQNLSLICQKCTENIETHSRWPAHTTFPPLLIQIFLGMCRIYLTPSKQMGQYEAFVRYRLKGLGGLCEPTTMSDTQISSSEYTKASTTGLETESSPFPSRYAALLRPH